jgi:hypothetical protein
VFTEFSHYLKNISVAETKMEDTKAKPLAGL